MPTLAESPEAGLAWRSIATRWERAGPGGRARLGAELHAFRARYPGEPVSALAEVWLAWLALERGDLEEAAELAHPSAAGPPGTRRDLARAIEGAVLRRAGRPKEALARLEPLAGKMLDERGRALVNDELISAAVAAGAWDRAIDAIEAGYRQAGADERQAFRARVLEVLPRIDDAALVRALGEGEDDRARLDEPMLALVARRVADRTIAKKDVATAKLLLRRAGPLLGDRGDEVARLAAGKASARVEARTVGLILPLRSDALRRRGAEVASGLAFGLGLPGSEARLVTQSDFGDLARLPEALATLAASGASVIVAGYDGASATVAARFAAEAKVPLLLLTAPSAASPGGVSPYVFLVGDDPRASADALVRAVSARAGSVLLVEEPTVSRPEGSPPRLVCPFDPDAERRCPGGLVLAADRPCAEAALEAFLEACPRTVVGAGLDATVALPPRALVARAGAFPVDAYTAEPSISAWIARKRAAPSWWAALGRDAGVLAWAGVRNLPAKATEDAAEVARRRNAAAAALSNQHEKLWTTDARGFDGRRVLPRSVSVREVR